MRLESIGGEGGLFGGNLDGQGLAIEGGVGHCELGIVSLACEVQSVVLTGYEGNIVRVVQHKVDAVVVPILLVVIED